MATTLRVLQAIDELYKAGLDKLGEQYLDQAGFSTRQSQELGDEIEQHLTNTQAMSSAASQYGIPLVTILCKN